MAKVLTDLVFRMQTDIAELKKGIAQANQSLGGFSKGIKGLGVGLAAAFSVGAVINFAKENLKAADIVIRAQEKVRQAVKSTGGAAGLAADDILKAALKTEKVTLFNEEDILQVSAVLLTFKKIGADVFNEVQNLALDMATVMGTDAKAAALQLGKAFEDPIRGITALRKSGVSFSEQQLEQIKAMEKVGNRAGVNALLIKELNSQFGGQAQAAAQVGIGSINQLEKAYSGWAESLSLKLLPSINNVAAALIKFFTSSGDLAVQQNDSFNNLTKAVGPLVEEYEELTSKGALTTAEQGRLTEVIDAIAKALPIAVTAWDDQGKAIGINVVALKEYIEFQKAALALDNAKQIKKDTKALYEYEAANKGILKTLNAKERTAKIDLGNGASQIVTYKLTNEEIASLTVRYKENEDAARALRGRLAELSGDQSFITNVMKTSTGAVITNTGALLDDADAIRQVNREANELRVKDLEIEIKIDDEALKNNTEDILAQMEIDFAKDPIPLVIELDLTAAEAASAEASKMIGQIMQQAAGRPTGNGRYSLANLISETDVPLDLAIKPQGIQKEDTLLNIDTIPLPLVDLRQSETYLAILDLMVAKNEEFMTSIESIGSTIVNMMNALANIDFSENFAAGVATIAASLAQLIPNIVSAISAFQALTAAKAVSGAAALPFPASVAAILTVVATVASVFAGIKSLSVGKKAIGGLAEGFTMVGERGPELVNFGQTARVYSASQTKRLQNGGIGDQIRYIISGESLIGVSEKVNNKNKVFA